MSSITNGNDFKRGWEEGHKAALEGKDKDYIRMGLSWKFVFHGNTALNSYTDGYDKGYEAGISEKNVVRKVEQINDNMSNNSANFQNLSVEKRAIENLNNLLVQFHEEIKSLSGGFEQFMAVLLDTGIPVEEVNAFNTECYTKDKGNFKAIWSALEQYDLPKIHTYHEMICEQIQAATGRPVDMTLRRPSYIPPLPPEGAEDRKKPQQDLEIQIEALRGFMNYLVNVRDLLRDYFKNYKDRVEKMFNSGVPIQIIKDYHPDCTIRNRNNIDKAINNLEQVDYPQLNSLFIQTAKSLRKLGIDSVPAPKSM